MSYQPNQRFNDLYLDLIQVSPLNSNIPLIKSLLDSAFTLNYETTIPFYNDHKTSKVTMKLCELGEVFEPDSKELKQICDLIMKLTDKQKTFILPSSVNLLLQMLQKFWLKLVMNLNESDSATYTNLVSVVGAIAAVVYGNGAHIENDLLNWLVCMDMRSIALLTIRTSLFKLRKVCLQCLKGLCFTAPSRESRLSEERLMQCSKVFFYILQLDHTKTVSSNYNLVYTAMRGIKTILESPGNKKVDDLYNAIVSLKRAAGFGRTSNNTDGLNTSLKQLQLGQSSSSESDMSDTELFLDSNKKKFTSSFRQLAMDCLLSLIKKTPKQTIYSHWDLLLHEIHGTSLLSCLKIDPLPKVRVLAAIAITNLLDSGKNFLSLSIVEPVKSRTAYVSYASKMATSIYDVHENLIYCLYKEPCISVKNHILKALSTAATMTPYAKLNSGILTRLVSNVKAYFNPSINPNTQVIAFGVFNSLLNNPSITKELEECLSKKEEGSLKSWLVEHCIETCKYTDIPNKTNIPKTAALQTLTSMSNSYFSLQIAYINELLDIAMQDSVKTSLSFTLHSCKMIEGLGRGLNTEIKSNYSSEIVEISLHFWNILTSKLITKFIDVKDHSILGEVCGILSVVGSYTYSKLSSKEQNFCITTLLNLLKSDNYLVRLSAMRCFANYLLYPYLRTNNDFLKVVVNCIIKFSFDPSKSVQTNATWAFANLTDSLVANKTNKLIKPNFLDDELLKKLFEIATTRHITTKDKARFNTMRILGNLLHILEEHHALLPKFLEYVNDSKKILIHFLETDQLTKVQWNACMALGNFLSNKNLPLEKPGWSDDVYNVLANSLANSQNFKVKIKSCIAISYTSDRNCYGQSFVHLFMTVFNQMKNTTIKTTSYNFEEKLQKQLLLTIIHLIQHMTGSDCDAILKQIQNSNRLNYVSYLVNLSKIDFTKEAAEESSEETIDDDESLYSVLPLSAQEKLRMLNCASSVWKKKLELSSLDLSTVNENVLNLFEYKEFSACI